jgi:uncharacterized peroxidase-related enzyme
MPWIKTVPLSQAGEELRAAFAAQARYYPPEYFEQVPGLDTKDDGGIVAAHSLLPSVLEHAFSTFGALLDPTLPLTRRQHELIATAVSVTNRTFHCSTAHAEFLRLHSNDELAAALATDPTSASLDPVERAIVDYAVQVTRDATTITPAHHDRLRSVGFEDVGILQITLIAAWFNYINRVADALGVSRNQPGAPPLPAA